MSCLSISGLYFLTGWVSKDAILLAMFRSSSPLLGLILFYAGALLTMTYCVRLCFCCFTADAGIVPLCCSTTSPSLFIFPSLSLLILSVLEGWVLASSFSLQCPVVCGIDMFVLFFLFVISCSMASSLARKQFLACTSLLEAGRLVGLAVSRYDLFFRATSLESLRCSAFGLGWGNRSVTAAVPFGPFTVRTLLFLRLGAVLL